MYPSNGRRHQSTLEKRFKTEDLVVSVNSCTRKNATVFLAIQFNNKAKIRSKAEEKATYTSLHIASITIRQLSRRFEGNFERCLNPDNLR